MSKHIILFLAANPLGTTELALGREARAIQEELERSGQRERFEFVTRWAVQPLDLIRELRKLKPTVVHFSGHGRSGGRQPNTRSRRDSVAKRLGDASSDDGDHQAGLFFQGLDGRPQLVTAAALRETFGAAGTSVKLVVLNACYSGTQAEALLLHLDCVVGMGRSFRDDAARAFAIGFYGGLGEQQSVAAAYRQGCAAISLEESPVDERPQLRVRDGVDADKLVLTEIGAVVQEVSSKPDLARSAGVPSTVDAHSLYSATSTTVAQALASGPARPIPAYPDVEIEQLSKRLEDAQKRRDKLRDTGIATEHVDHEILELRRRLREGGRLRPGDALSDGRYLLVNVLGTGGFATVWDAHDCIAKQRVAIKVLHANLGSDSQRRERFFRGAHAMMRLAHPGVTRVLEPKGEDGGFYYFVMEFVPGGNLRDAILARRLKRSELLPLIIRTGEALAFAQAQGMVHRDVKPTNILLGEEGNTKLTDFDLVSTHDTTGGTRTGVLGTVVYAAPECLEKPQEATARADVYGLGMTAIFCLSGRDLSMDTFRNPEGSIAELDCPVQVQNVLRQAVAWKPENRFADAAAMVVELCNASNPTVRETTAVQFVSMFRGQQREDLPTLIPALTIMSHPIMDRVGERLLLEAVAAGREIMLSNNAPNFTRPGGGVGQPLNDPFVSQKPIRFAPAGDGGVRVVVDREATPVYAGSWIDGSARFTHDDLVHGVVLELAERVVLLLHWFDQQVEESADSLGMIGASAAIKRIRSAIERVVDLAVPVLIRGETGTGKELVARAIHDKGPRRRGPFVSVNLGAVPRELAAAELFGAVRGAFTGASRDRIGLFRAAHGGTLFLDEVGEAPPEVQVMLLRVLEAGDIYPVGADRSVPTDVRVIAATDANLEQQIERGQFRMPLLHRLAGFKMQIPPLRERREDIGLLFYHFAREDLAALGESHRLSPEAPYARPWLPAHVAAQLLHYTWPGNVRELRNLTRQLLIENRGLPQLRLDPRLANQLGVAARFSQNGPPRSPEGPVVDLPPPASNPHIETRRKSSDVTEHELQDALQASAWDFKAAADRLRIPRSSIYKLIERSGHVRTAGDLGPEEIMQCFQTCAGDLNAMAARLQVSRRGLSRRLRELGLASR